MKLLHAIFWVKKRSVKNELVKAILLCFHSFLSTNAIFSRQKSFTFKTSALFHELFRFFSLWISSITVLVMWRDRKASSTAFLLINLAITDTLTLFGFWFMQTLLLLDNNFDSVNTGQWSNILFCLFSGNNDGSSMRS